MSGIDIESLKAQIESEAALINSAAELGQFRIKYLGRKGVIADLTGLIPSLPKQERAVFGQLVNTLKNRVSSLISEKEISLRAATSVSQQAAFPVDISMPGIASDLGRIHPITQVINEICSIFTRMGFLVIEGPEIETEENNFTGLNIPLEHPSRDTFDTFYLDTRSWPALSTSASLGVNSVEGMLDAGKSEKRESRIENRFLLRSHTSPVQVRIMKKRKPPLAVVAPGRVYRPDAVDASHLFMFHQVEGFVVGEGIKFSDLKGVLELFAKAVFGQDIKMRFRPHFFPFTEPSAEIDVSCIICKGVGCSVCGRKGWLEVLGSGMIHPNVFKNVGYDSKKYTGFAFGMGVERITMLKYGINDIRLFFENDLNFLKQF